MNRTRVSTIAIAAALVLTACGKNNDDNNNNGTNPPVTGADMSTTTPDVDMSMTTPAVDMSTGTPDMTVDVDMGGGNEDMGNDPDPTCENYCDTVTANCTGDNKQYDSKETCMDYCENVGGWQAGTAGDTDGDTIACRTYHGGQPAIADSALHCDHAGPSGGGVCGDWCDVYCALSFEHCVGPNKHYDTPQECATACAGFNDGGQPGDVQYDTVQCRIYHLGSPAASMPDAHCPHGGEEPTSECVGANTDFLFRTDGFDTYTRVDRIGMPAVSTALITDKQAYNMANPADDANGMFTVELITAIVGLHTALDDQLIGLGLTPCTAPGDGSGSCVAAGGPLVIPDTLKLDTEADAGFPNGRRLADPVMDITLAVILLELADGTHMATDLVGVLNPTENDLGVEGAFLTAFPYLHAPHMP